jgi:hypothetical protein
MESPLRGDSRRCAGKRSCREVRTPAERKAEGKGQQIATRHL